MPDECHISFVQILSRHGARNPTASKSASYQATIKKIKSRVSQFSAAYAFLAKYEYTLGADSLTTFGQQEMVNSGFKFYTRYQDLAKDSTPFIRASGQARVIESAHNFSQGYHQARLASKVSKTTDKYPYPIVIISEANGSNNTLSHGLCREFENGRNSDVATNAQKKWQAIFIPPITARLNAGLKGAKLDASDTISLMDLCPFDTVASAQGQVSLFCNLFTETEWREYDYYQSLNKYYGYSSGNPLGPTQGVGFTNELIARMTEEPVDDHTSVNHTLDRQQATFPIGVGQVLYADFSHDKYAISSACAFSCSTWNTNVLGSSDMTAIFSAMGLYNSTRPLSNTSIQSTAQTKGYSASWTVPFAARAYFEKMICKGESEELVRIVVNDRVLPLATCDGDVLGRCTLSKFIQSLSFAVEGGNWDECLA